MCVCVCVCVNTTQGGRRYVDVKGRFEREGTDDEEERRTYGGDL